MIDRSIQLMDAIKLYQEHYKHIGELDKADCLTLSDWHELTDLQTLLKPLRECSLNIKSTADDGNHGALHETLTSLDFLLTVLEAKRKETFYQDDSHFKASVNLGWKKLEYYYALTDCVPAYRLSVFLHPHYKMRWFNKHWQTRKDWLNAVDELVSDAYHDCKRAHANDVVRSSPKAIRHRSAFDEYNDLDTDEELDDLVRYKSEPCERKGVNPLQWWIDNQQRFPVLRHLAFTVLAAPASTAADERLFSMAGNVVNENRPHTCAELAEATQCLRSWTSEGII